MITLKELWIMKKTYTLLESDTLLNGQRVGFGNDRNDIDNLGQFLEDNDIDWLQSIRQKCPEIERQRL